MKKTVKIMLFAAVMCLGTTAFAGPHGKPGHHRDGLDLANGIVDLVLKVIRPEPAVIHHRPVILHQPAVIHHPPARHHRPAKKAVRPPAPPKPRHR